MEQRDNIGKARHTHYLAILPRSGATEVLEILQGELHADYVTIHLGSDQSLRDQE